MRFVIFGAGAIGGLVGARLHQSGQEVLLIARGAHHDAIARDGLTLVTPTERETLKLPVARDAATAALREDDVILLCVKSQDTWGALLALHDAAPSPDIPIVCMQNGVENERVSLRLFPNTYGAMILIPADHLEPGVVLGYASNYSGCIDLGRYPHGVDAATERIAAALNGARFDTAAHPQVMDSKYGKLLSNLGNGIQAICGMDDRAANAAASERAEQEARTILNAAGITFDASNIQQRWQRVEIGVVDGRPREGGSTWQSVKRGAGSVETDYLNGEIVLLARELGLKAPVNETVQSLTRETLVRGLQPGWLSASELIARADELIERADGRSSAPQP